MSECVNGRDCAGFDPVAKLADRARAGSPMCEWCLKVASADIEQLVADYVDLEAELVPAQRGMRERVACGGAVGSVPLALDIEALQRSIVWTLTVWEPPVRELAGLSPERTDNVRDGWAVKTAVSIIVPRIALLAGLGDTWGFADGLAAGPVVRNGIHAVASLRTLHRQARSAVGATELVHALPGVCAGCRANALRRANGSDQVFCDVCHRCWTIEDYRRYVRLRLDEAA